jgi:hypothetical protein
MNASEHDNAVISLNVAVTHYYRDIWSSLTPEEKVMVYDLAEEGLLNTANYMTLYSLIKKSLIIRKDDRIYHLINESFRHYVLSIITKEEIEKAENEINENSMWKDFRGPVLVIIAAMLWFVLYSNQDQFGAVFPIITAMAAGLPTLIKLFSYFLPGSAKVGV